MKKLSTMCETYQQGKIDGLRIALELSRDAFFAEASVSLFESLRRQLNAKYTRDVIGRLAQRIYAEKVMVEGKSDE